MAKTKFEKPDFETVVDYFRTKGADRFMANEFYLYYEENDWHIGSRKMKVWALTASRWIARQQRWESKRQPLVRPGKQSLRDRSVIDNLTDTSWADDIDLNE